MGYLRRILNYPERIALSNLTYLMIMADFVAISVESPKVDNRSYVEKEFSILIYINP